MNPDELLKAIHSYSNVAEWAVAYVGSANYQEREDFAMEKLRDAEEELLYVFYEFRNSLEK